jgi:hypothetical protein
MGASTPNHVSTMYSNTLYYQLESIAKKASRGNCLNHKLPQESRLSDRWCTVSIVRQPLQESSKEDSRFQLTCLPSTVQQLHHRILQHL